jgi:hypothetical protein
MEGKWLRRDWARDIKASERRENYWRGGWLDESKKLDGVGLEIYFYPPNADRWTPNVN